MDPTRREAPLLQPVNSIRVRVRVRVRVWLLLPQPVNSDVVLLKIEYKRRVRVRVRFASMSMCTVCSDLKSDKLIPFDPDDRTLTFLTFIVLRVRVGDNTDVHYLHR